MENKTGRFRFILNLFCQIRFQLKILFYFAKILFILNDVLNCKPETLFRLLKITLLL